MHRSSDQNGGALVDVTRLLIHFLTNLCRRESLPPSLQAVRNISRIRETKIGRRSLQHLADPLSNRQLDQADHLLSSMTMSSASVSPRQIPRSKAPPIQRSRQRFGKVPNLQIQVCQLMTQGRPSPAIQVMKNIKTGSRNRYQTCRRPLCSKSKRCAPRPCPALC